MSKAMALPFQSRRACITGGAGFLGGSVCAKLRERGVREIFIPRSSDFDLTTPVAAARMFDAARPDIVVHLAAEVGGIGANQAQPGRFFYANLMMGMNLIEEARRRGIEKFVQVGTVCSYPKLCEVPFRENDLWSGFPEETNAPYGVAKRALGVMLDAYHRQYGLSAAYVILANLYGPGDNFDPRTSHVIPALIRKFTEAVSAGRDRVMCWGTGRASREFLYVEDAAEGILAAAERMGEPTPINLGTGRETTIADVARMIADLVGYTGRIEWDASRPDGQPRRRLDTSRAEEVLGWRAGVKLEEGLRRTAAWWREHGNHPNKQSRDREGAVLNAARSRASTHVAPAPCSESRST
jgi:GDP-L-fucose synthase